MTIRKFQETILSWYKTNKRDLLWRDTKDPYKILVSEVMLQQTQVTRVIPKYEEFLKAFPTLEKLARASDKKLLKIWAGLGYWRRAKYLKEVAKTMVGAKKTSSKMSPRRPLRGREHRPQNLPDFEGRSFWSLFSKPAELEKLPGIGPYTARAVACFAFGNKDAFLDTNIRRVYLHFFFPLRRGSGQAKKVSDKEILKIAQRVSSSLCHGKNLITTKEVMREWHYALFDYGATVLKNSEANRRSKHYAKQSKFEGSFRSFRTKVVNFLLLQKQNRAPLKTVEALLKQSPYPKEKVLASLLKDRLIKQSASHYSL